MDDEGCVKSWSATRHDPTDSGRVLWGDVTTDKISENEGDGETTAWCLSMKNNATAVFGFAAEPIDRLR